MKLLPCPFCGHKEPEIVRYGTRRMSTQYECGMCGCRLETPEEWDHGRTWNTRWKPEVDMNIKDMVSDNKKVTFQFYKDGALWYKTETDFTFPVPIEDIGSATFLAEDKALLFMRYIRKHLDTIKSAEQEAHNEGKDISG